MICKLLLVNEENSAADGQSIVFRCSKIENLAQAVP